MEKYIHLNNQLLKLSFANQLKNGRYVIGFWINQGSIDQDLLTILADEVIKTTRESKEIYEVTSIVKTSPS